jgi:hypothetical protein
MTVNKSLELSHRINDMMSKDLLSLFYNLFPFDLELNENGKKSRDRVFNPSNTLLSMINTMIQQDKTLQNSVNIFHVIHNKNIESIQSLEKKLLKKEQSNPKRGVGRPRKNVLKIQKSKITELSRNTSAYAQARQRLSNEYVNAVFKASVDYNNTRSVSKFHGREVYITDGTYLQLQDTKSIREIFNNSTKEGYPRGLLSVVIRQGTGSVADFTLDSDKKSELELFGKMINNLKPGSLLLADDLYNCFAIFCLLQRRGVDIIVPGKRDRKYTVIEKIAEGDEIVEILDTGKKSKMNEKFGIHEKKIRLRRIETTNPNNENEKVVLFTSLLDKNITKEEIILKYFTRWDIEISIREIKTIMDINIVRSKTPDMVIKELSSALTAYNYIRKIIEETAFESDFSPENDIFQKFNSSDKTICIDKLGRVYTHWSPGRNGNSEKKNPTA